jgi:uncharacterized protein (DUF2141 family)
MTALLTALLMAGLWTQPAPAARLVVDLGGFESDTGHARVLLFRTAEGFPRDKAKAAGIAVVPIEGRRARAVFDDLPPGDAAVAAYHDEDDDQKMNRSVFGWPTEAYGASNDARATFGPPSFEAARVVLPSGELRVEITLR